MRTAEEKKVMSMHSKVTSLAPIEELSSLNGYYLILLYCLRLHGHDADGPLLRLLLLNLYINMKR